MPGFCMFGILDLNGLNQHLNSANLFFLSTFPFCSIVFQILKQSLQNTVNSRYVELLKDRQKCSRQPEFKISRNGLKTKKITWYTLSPTIFSQNYPADIYLLRVINRNTRTRCEICLKLTLKTPERHQVLTLSR